MQNFFEKLRQMIKPVVRQSKQFSSCRFDTSDVVQDMMLQIWRDIGGIESSPTDDPSQHLSEVKTKSGLPITQAWLYRIAQGTVANHCRYHYAQKRSVEREESGDPNAFYAGQSPDEIAANRESARLVSQSVASLEEPQRTIVQRRLFENASFVDIGKDLGLNMHTVRSNYKAGLLAIRTEITAAEMDSV